MISNATLNKLPTPAYVYDASVLQNRCRNLRKYFPGVKVFYAVKANSNPTILKLIYKEGLGFETVSPGEIRAAIAAGATRERISFTCSNLTEDDLVFAAKHAGHVHLDSLQQMEIWGRRKLGKEISIRINEGLGAGSHQHLITGGPDSKFGISKKDLPEARRIAKKYGLKIVGVQQHIGTSILNKEVGMFFKGVVALLSTARSFPDVRHVDFGGGFGVAYRPTDKVLDLSKFEIEFARVTQAFAKERGGKVTFALEPGRYVVADSGTLLVSVVDLKSTSKHQFVGINSGMSHLIRPAMYDAYHQIENISRPKGPKKSVTIGGNICESSDIFAKHRTMVSPRIGDKLAIRTAGAYGMSMASVYTLRELPKEILIQKGKAKDISFSPEARVRSKR